MPKLNLKIGDVGPDLRSYRRSLGRSEGHSGERGRHKPRYSYRIEAQQTGFKKYVRRGITVDINQVVTLNISMALGQMQEVVDVTSEAPQVDTTNTQLGAVT